MYPFVFLAVLMVALLLAKGLSRPRPAPFLAAALWAAFAVYEYYIAIGVLCDANCNIRVDLILFLPLLIWAIVLGLKEDASPRAVAAFGTVCLLLAALMLALFGKTMLAALAAAGAMAVVVYAARAGRPV